MAGTLSSFPSFQMVFAPQKTFSVYYSVYYRNKTLQSMVFWENNEQQGGVRQPDAQLRYCY